MRGALEEEVVLLLQRQVLLEEEPEGATSVASADASANDGTPGRGVSLRSSTGCGRSSAARAQRDCPAASSEAVSPVPVGLRARLAPPPLRRLSCPSSVPVGRRASPATAQP